jgi:hypothetical protein
LQKITPSSVEGRFKTTERCASPAGQSKRSAAFDCPVHARVRQAIHFLPPIAGQVTRGCASGT